MSLFGNGEEEPNATDVLSALSEIIDRLRAQNVLLARIAKAMENLEEHLVEAHT